MVTVINVADSGLGMEKGQSLFQDGFESGDFSNWDSNSGAVSVQNTIKKTGAYAMKVLPVNLNASFVSKDFLSAEGMDNYVIDFDLYVKTIPSDLTEIVRVENNAGNEVFGIQIGDTNGDGTYALGWSTEGAIVWDFSIFNPETWYKIKISINRAVGWYKIMIDNGNYTKNFYTFTNKPKRLKLGVNLISGAVEDGEFYFDNVNVSLGEKTIQLNSSSESGSGADRQATQQTATQINDSGNGNEGIGLLNSANILETALGQDIIEIIARLAISDSVISSDVISILNANVNGSVLGQGIDNVALTIYPQIKDSGSGIDIISKLVSAGVSEQAIATDILNILARLNFSDEILSQDSIVAELITCINISDNGVATEKIDKYLIKMFVSKGSKYTPKTKAYFKII